jgi:hypothetical protein
MQALPHIPQFAASVCRFTQVELQAIIPPPQLSPGIRHAPAIQLCPVAQAVPHVPQFLASVWVLTQTPLQTIDGAEQAAATAPPAPGLPPRAGAPARPPEGPAPPLLIPPPGSGSGSAPLPPTSAEQPIDAAPKAARAQQSSRARAKASEKRERCPAVVVFFITVTREDSPRRFSEPVRVRMVRSFRYRDRGTDRTGECLEGRPKAHTAARGQSRDGSSSM